MSLRQSLARFLVVIAPIVLTSVSSTQSRAQSEGDNATAVAPLFKTISVTPTKFGIHADRNTKISPDGLTVANETVQELIRGAYDVKDDQIVGAPGWLNSQRYDIDAKVGPSADGEGTLASEALQERTERMLQALLSSRFKLVAHRQTRMVPVYELVVAGDGAKLRESIPADADSDALRVIQVGSGRIMGREVPTATLARMLSEQLGRPVLDKTGLSNHYDITLEWQANSELPGAAISAALQEQLGLKLMPQLMPKEFLVIDHVEMPSADQIATASF
ncbi:MAG TPA: TIGR03435 family protein [Terriglobales bacterium]|nr:TIGR03435 family protein [Terriglobales bacterium]